MTNKFDNVGLKIQCCVFQIHFGNIYDSTVDYSFDINSLEKFNDVILYSVKDTIKNDVDITLIM